MKVNQIKSKVAAKVAKGKAKVAAKCGKAAKCAAVVFGLASLVLTGCATAENKTPTKAQNSTQEDNTYNIYSYVGGCRASTNSIPSEVWSRIPDSALADVIASMFRPAVNVEIGNQAQANETSGTETLTSTPTQTPTLDIKTDITAHYNDAIAAASTASKSVLGQIGDGLTDVLDLMSSKKSGTVAVTKKDGTQAIVKCADGQCEFCEVGNCSECADGSCEPTQLSN